MVARKQRLTKRQQRLSENGKKEVIKFPTINQLHLNLILVEPKTQNQEDVFEDYEDNENIVLVGCAGTGKTFISMYLALKEIADSRSPLRKLVIIRSAQPGKQIGFLPGTEEQKLEPYEAPYKALCSKLYGRDDAYEILKQKGIIKFTGTSFLRGTEIDNSVILVDEVQNLSYEELRTCATRTGENSRLILCGDTRQDDLTSARFKETSGLPLLLKVLERIDSVSIIEFEVEDIVRSGFVRDFIAAEYELDLY